MAFSILLARLLPLALLAMPSALATQWVPRSPAGAVYDLVMDPSDPEHLFASTDTSGRAYHESSDGGVSWAPVSMPNEAFSRARLTVSVTGDVFLCLGRSSAPVLGNTFVVRRTSTGWVPFGPTTTAPRAYFASQLRIGEANPDLMALIMVENGTATYGLDTFLYLSDDGGQTWDLPSPWLGNPTSLEIIELAAGPRILRLDEFQPSTGVEYYAVISDAWEPPTRLVMWTSDNVVLSVTSSRTYPERLILTAFDFQEYTWNSQFMRRSDDFGRTWSDVGPSGYYSSGQRGELDPELWVRHSGRGPAGAVQLSRDSGLTWLDIVDPPGAGGVRLELRLTGDDSKLYAFGSLFQPLGLYVMDVTAEIGTNECSALPNSTGRQAALSAHGSLSLSASDMTLWGRDLPPSSTALLLTSEDAGFTPHPAGSFGNLCLGGSIGRFVNDVEGSGPYGEVVMSIDPTSLPSPTGAVAPVVGETWRFQLWFRDQIGGQPGSHFSDAVAVTLTQ